MTAAGWLQLAALILFIVVGTRLLGPYLAGIYSTGVDAPEKRPLGDRVFRPIERLIYRLCGVDEKREQRWSIYALSLLAFSLVSVLHGLRVPAAPGCAAGQPQRRRERGRRRCRSTPRSAS